MTVQDFDLFMEKVFRKTGIDLTKYKRPQMERRLTALREKHGYKDFAAYFQAIDRDQDLFNEFLDRMTINVSEFFRNANRWEVVMNRIIPELLKNKRRLKIWSAACSTGEEPYTLALIMSKHLPLNEVEILATDIDQNALERAKLGIYHSRSLEAVPKDLLQKYFAGGENGMYRIADEIKRCVKFRRQNLLEDTFEKDFDLIVCRNVIIYFTEEAKDLLYHKFSSALRPGGILFVGSTEQIFNPQTYGFQPYDTFFYQKAK
ncbi:CheR family methyltransferase [Effusibacillus lacus]|uniref:protein-glutamate O-methyltransferase n=1 Tax=Effusibacillus lacus TaxID=1348429 RepID=A0A292YII9_9BACL|nr:protein-glutamate O-methyltransferase CheR [Effusibacillus lacus]TCS75290.1 chemotaxis protein methyltransferase CheR [Effusibacillus lacus]GAX89728.1 chemotaxis protein CheR [Effusibacillus lacus]